MRVTICREPRLSAAQLLQHPWFQPTRRASLARPAGRQPPLSPLPEAAGDDVDTDSDADADAPHAATAAAHRRRRAHRSRRARAPRPDAEASPPHPHARHWRGEPTADATAVVGTALSP